MNAAAQPTWLEERDLWTFSLALYAEPGAAAACLALQDRHGVDVALALASCWFAGGGVALAPVTIGALRDRHRARAGPARTLRAARAAAATLRLGSAEDVSKAAWRALDRKILAVEIEAERVAVEALARDLPQPSLVRRGDLACDATRWLRLFAGAPAVSAVADLAAATAVEITKTN